jgi:GTP cyclohydrolase III
MSGLHSKLESVGGSRDNLMQRAKFISKFVITSNTDVKTVVRPSNEIVNYSKINVDAIEAWN